MTYKLHLYAAYLPLSSGEISFAPGQDPITLRDKIIADKDKLLKQRKSEIENLKKTLEEDYVLKSEFVTMESSLNSLIVF